jgi:phenylalanyl-tRNA synthetase beta chain
VRVFEVGAVFLRNDAVADGPLSVAGYRPAQARGRHGLRSGRRGAVGPADPRGRLLRRQGRPGSAVFAAPAALHARPSIRRCTRAARATVELDGKPVGFIGELHPRWLQKYDLPQAPVLFEVDADALQERDVPSYTEISKFPGATRDLALVVKNRTFRRRRARRFRAEVSAVEPAWQDRASHCFI